MRWGELYDVNGFQDNVSVPLAEFEDANTKLRKLDITAILPAVQKSDSQAIAWTQQLQDCADADARVKVPQMYNIDGKKKRSIVYGGYCDADLQVVDAQCAILRKRSKQSVVKMVESLKSTQPVLIKHIDAIDLHFKCNQQPRLRPQSGLLKIAQRFIKKNFGSMPYLAVHLRRNEFVRKHPTLTPEVTAAAARINRMLKQYRLEQVFVATDARPAYQDELRRLVKAPLYYFAPDDGAPDLQHKGKEEVVVAQILAKAQQFIGTSSCPFSAAVACERDHLGMLHKTSQVFCASLNSSASERECPMPS